jgi:hypothetical protein
MAQPYYFTLLHTHRYFNQDRSAIDFRWLQAVLIHSQAESEKEELLLGPLCFCDTFVGAVAKINEHSWYKRSSSYMVVKVWISPEFMEDEPKSEQERFQHASGEIISSLTGKTKYRYAKDWVDQGSLFDDCDSRTGVFGVYPNVEEVTVRDRKDPAANQNTLYKNEKYKPNPKYQ